MLKIKDNVDLNELYKFGFKKNKYEELSKIIYEGRRGQSFEIIINEYNRRIDGYSYGCDGDGEEQPIDNTLYDLIKADLVEKVSDE